MKLNLYKKPEVFFKIKKINKKINKKPEDFLKMKQL